ncbi:MAG: hypothetical protein HY874_04975 [Chloroflexi bacterium]|nr:hypothetical protein [Chloroflexota bacterium]
MADTPRAIQEASRKLVDLRRQLETAEAKVSEVRGKLNEYEAFIKVWKELSPEEAEPEFKLNEDARTKLIRKVKGKKLADAVEIALQESGGVLTTRQLAALLVSIKALKDSKWAYNTTHKTLKGAPKRFRQIRSNPATWGLSNAPSLLEAS